MKAALVHDRGERGVKGGRRQRGRLPACMATRISLGSMRPCPAELSAEWPARRPLRPYVMDTEGERLIAERFQGSSQVDAVIKRSIEAMLECIGPDLWEKVQLEPPEIAQITTVADPLPLPSPA
eukprot:5827816-Prymnesium_polylepis.1